jgi:hypothetical protein
MFYTNTGKKYGKRLPGYEYPAFNGATNHGIIHSCNFSRPEDISVNNLLLWPMGIDLQPYLAVIPKGRYTYNLRVMEYNNTADRLLLLMPSHNDVASYAVPICQTVVPHSGNELPKHTTIPPTLTHGYLSPQFDAQKGLHEGEAYPNATRYFMVLFAIDQNIRTKKLDKERVFACPNLEYYKLKQRHHFNHPVTGKIMGVPHPLYEVWNKPDATYGDFTKALYDYPGIFRKHARRFSHLYKKQV